MLDNPGETVRRIPLRYGAIERNIQERSRELHVKGEELKSIQNLISDSENQLRSKEEECNRNLKMITDLIIEGEEVLKSIQRNIEECSGNLGKKEEQLISLEKHTSLKDAEFQALSRKYENDYEKREGELKSMQKEIARCDEELKKKEKALDSKQKSIFELAGELESKRIP